MDAFGTTGAASLQSGFVLAAILLAVFFAERLGGSAQLALRSFQVTVGLALAFVAISGTTAFDRAPALPEEVSEAIGASQDFQDDETLEELQASTLESTRTASEVRTIHAGLGFILLVAGLGLLTRFRVLPAGLMLGGLLLLLFGGPQPGGLGGFLDLFTSLFGALLPGAGTGGPGQARDIAHFAVLLFGTAALIAFGFLRWEGTESGTAATSPSAAGSPVGTA